MAARHVVRRPRKGARRDLPQGHRGRQSPALDRDLGDGRQTRSFTWIDDCLKGTVDILASDIVEPLNLGSSELVTLDQLVDIVESIAGLRLERRYNPVRAKGRLRTKQRQHEDTSAARMGTFDASSRRVEITYRWIHSEMTRTVAAGL